MLPNISNDIVFGDLDGPLGRRGPKKLWDAGPPWDRGVSDPVEIRPSPRDTLPSVVVRGQTVRAYGDSPEKTTLVSLSWSL